MRRSDKNTVEEMMSSNNEEDRPPAHPGREQLARETFPMQEMSPEEYAARHGADWACFSFDDYLYSDPKLDLWIQRLATILTSPPLLAECQEKYLNAEEMNRIMKRREEEL